MLQGSVLFFVQLFEANALQKKRIIHQYDEFLSFMCICNIFILKKAFAILSKNLKVFLPFTFIIHKAKQLSFKVYEKTNSKVIAIFTNTQNL